MDAKATVTQVDPNTSDFGITGSKIILNEKSGELFTRDVYGNVKQIGGGSLVIQSGTGAVTEDVQTELRSRVHVFQFMTAAQIADVQARTRTLDVAAAIRNADTQAALTGRGLEFGRGAYRCDSSPFSGSTANRKWFGCGDNGATIWKHFNGTFIPITACNGIEFHNMHLYGDQANFTGKGGVLSGVTNFARFPGTVFEGFQSTFLEFGADAGYDFNCVGAKFLLDRTNAQSALTMIAMAANDTVASHRHFVDVGIDGDIDMSGALATIITGSRFRNLITTNNTSVIEIGTNSWALTGGSATINAVNASVLGNRFGGSITLGAGSSGTFGYNQPTAGTFTNSATIAAWAFTHKDGGAVTIYVNQHLLDIQDSVANTIQACRCSFIGDADTTYTVGGGNRIFYQSAITATRTVTLSATNAKNGDAVRVSRQAGSTGAFPLNVGPIVKPLASGQWVEYVYDSSAWQISAFGSLSTAAPTAVTGATYTVDAADISVIANRAGTVTLTLPTASAWTGRRLRVVTIQAQTVVSAASNVVPQIGGAAGTAILAATAGKWADLDSDGTNWIITASN